jgi:hypothetical protein
MTTQWQLVRRGLWIGRSDGGTVYVSRTRDGWEYGTVAPSAPGTRGDLIAHDETTRPIQRAKLLAERCLAPNECEWFAGCGNAATHMEPHPILGQVPACDRCPTIGA